MRKGDRQRIAHRRPDRDRGKGVVAARAMSGCQAAAGRRWRETDSNLRFRAGTRSAVTLRRGLMLGFVGRRPSATCSGEAKRWDSRVGNKTPGGRPPSGLAGGSSAFPVIFAAAFFELCTHCCKPVLEDIDDRVADLGRRKGGSVYVAHAYYKFHLLCRRSLHWRCDTPR